eukprot:scaffold91_cov127-Cylindrotheca_fusiformis.AAC.15
MITPGSPEIPPLPTTHAPDLAAMGGSSRPRVDDIDRGKVWVGGSNIKAQQGIHAKSLLCYRPKDFRWMQRQYECLQRAWVMIISVRCSEEGRKWNLPYQSGTSQPTRL